MNHRHGTFCFAEIATPHPAQAQEYYGDLFGWTTLDVLSTSGGYSLLQSAGRTVAGLRHAPSGTTPRWIPYVSVSSVEDTLTAAMALGATMPDAPFAVPGVANMATLVDPAGRTIGLWQGDGCEGVDVKEVAGSLWWVELLARQTAPVTQFYASLFGWEVTAKPMAHLRNAYVVFKAGTESVGGAITIEPDWGATPERWQVLFAVNDFDGIIARAKGLGGSMEAPIDVPDVGRCALLRDNDKAAFIIMHPVARQGS